MLSIFASQIVEERITKLKHFQTTQGMQLLAYWLVTFLGDMFRLYVTIGINLAIFYAFELEFDYIWLPLLIWPWAILPFTYAMSFIFSSTNLA